MGDPKRLRKKYERPLRLWDAERIEREGKLREEYGLRNARELWKPQTVLRKIRREARRLLSKKGAKIETRTENLIKRVKSFILRKPEVTLDDILALELRDILERRLQTLVFRKHLAKTPTQARQFITHGHISVSGSKISVPSYMVKFSEEHEVDWYGEPIKFGAAAEGEEAGEKEPAPSAKEDEAKSAAEAQAA